MVFVSNHRDTHYRLVEEGTLDVINDSVDLILGCVNVGLHGAGRINEEEKVGRADGLEQTLRVPCWSHNPGIFYYALYLAGKTFGFCSGFAKGRSPVRGQLPRRHSEI